jgi:hypothetical protein
VRIADDKDNQMQVIELGQSIADKPKRDAVHIAVVLVTLGAKCTPPIISIPDDHDEPKVDYGLPAHCSCRCNCGIVCFPSFMSLRSADLGSVSDDGLNLPEAQVASAGSTSRSPTKSNTLCSMF